MSVFTTSRPGINVEVKKRPAIQVTVPQRPAIQVNAHAHIPARLSGSGGIEVIHDGNNWIIQPAWEELDLFVPGSLANKEMWIRDTVTGVYNRMPVSSIGSGGGGGGIALSLGHILVGDGLGAASDFGPTVTAIAAMRYFKIGDPVLRTAASFWSPTWQIPNAPGATYSGTGFALKVNRIQAGLEATASQDFPQTITTWPSNYIPSIMTGGTISATSVLGGNTIISATRTSDAQYWTGSSTGGAQAFTAVHVNDDQTGSAFGPVSCGFVGLGFHDVAGIGITVNQLDIICLQPVVAAKPSVGTNTASLAIPLLLTPGAIIHDMGRPLYDNSAALVIGAGGGGSPVQITHFQKGIVVFNDALTHAIGQGGQGVWVETINGQSWRVLDMTDTVRAEMWGATYGWQLKPALTITPNAGGNFVIKEAGAGTLYTAIFPFGPAETAGGNYALAAYGGDGGDKGLYLNRPTNGVIHFKEAAGADQVSILAGGNVTISNLKTSGTAPTITGTPRMVISDANGLLSFTAIPTGGGGGIALPLGHILVGDGVGAAADFGGTIQISKSPTEQYMFMAPPTGYYGLLTQQEMSGVHLGSHYFNNRISILDHADHTGNASGTGTDGSNYGFYVLYEVGGVATPNQKRGGAVATSSLITLTSPSALDSPHKDYIAMFTVGQANVNDGGSAGLGNGRGAIWGLNTGVQLLGGATFMSSMIGIEVDINTFAGSSLEDRFGILIAHNAGGDVVGSHNDAGIGFVSRVGTSHGWRDGIAFYNKAGVSEQPIQPTGSIIRTDGDLFTCANGIDFHTAGFSGFFLRGPGDHFTVDGNGLIKTDVTSKTQNINFPSFDGQTYPGGHSIMATFNSASLPQASGLVVQVMNTPIQVNSGALVALAGGFLNQVSGTDAGAVVGYAANANTVADSGGAAIWGIARRTGGKGATTVTGLRASSETGEHPGTPDDPLVDGTPASPVPDHPYAGVSVGNSTPTNAWKKGVAINSAENVGIQIGCVFDDTSFGLDFVRTPAVPMVYYGQSARASSCIFSGTTLTAGGTITGKIELGQLVFAGGITGSPIITALGTGTGGAGTYTISVSQPALGPVNTIFQAAARFKIVQSGGIAINPEARGGWFFIDQVGTALTYTGIFPWGTPTFANYALAADGSGADPHLYINRPLGGSIFFKAGAGGTNEVAIQNGGLFAINTLKSGGAAPVTTGSTMMVICDANGLLSFTPISTGGGGGITDGDKGDIVVSGGGTTWLLDPTINKREVVTTDRTYYVNNSTGSDSNTGLTAPTAFATIAKAVDTICDTLYVKSGNIAVQLATTGVNYDEYVFLRPNFCSVSAGPGPSIYIRGDAASAANVVIKPTGVIPTTYIMYGVVQAQGDGAQWGVHDVTVDPSSANAVANGTCCYFSTMGAKLYVYGGNLVHYNASVGMWALEHGFIAWNASIFNYGVDSHVTGNTLGNGSLVYSSWYSTVYVNANITWDVDPNYWYTVYIGQNSKLFYYHNVTFTGTVTGGKYYVESNSVGWSDDANENDFPGNAAGFVQRESRWSYWRFIDLKDVPRSYAGAGGQYVRVNAGATGLEFAAVSGGSGTPGGSTTHVQFNDAGALGGTTGFTFDKVTSIGTIGTFAAAGKWLINYTTDINVGGFPTQFQMTANPANAWLAAYIGAGFTSAAVAQAYGKTRGVDPGTHGDLNAGDTVGSFWFYASSGGAWRNIANQRVKNILGGGTSTPGGMMTWELVNTSGSLFVRSLVFYPEIGTGALLVGGDTASAPNNVPARTLHGRFIDTTTNTVVPTLLLQRDTSGTPAVGIGTGIEFSVLTAGGVNKIGATIEVAASSVTSSSEAFNLKFRTMAAGALRDSLVINSANTVAVDSLACTTFAEFTEMVTPSAPAANKARLFSKDNGAGKTQICVLFPSGATQVIATEP